MSHRHFSILAAASPELQRPAVCSQSVIFPVDIYTVLTPPLNTPYRANVPLKQSEVFSHSVVAKLAFVLASVFLQRTFQPLPVIVTGLCRPLRRPSDRDLAPIKIVAELAALRKRLERTRKKTDVR